MTKGRDQIPSEFYSNLKIFHELMRIKVREILFVSSPYDAFIMEEDGSPASRIINEYSGLNLSLPPRVTRTSSAKAALSMLGKKKYDMVITMPNLTDMGAFSFGREAKNLNPDLPVILLVHNLKGIYPFPEGKDCSGIDKVFIWSGNSDLLLALVKNVEDNLNVGYDTDTAMVRVLILVEDSPVYYSSFLPLIYKEVVKQTQAVLEVGLNEEHRLLTMRARPKILLANNYEDAMRLYQQYRSYVFGIISDTRIPKEGHLSDDAGALLLSNIRKDIPDLPLLLMSSQSDNRTRAEEIPAVFLDKHSPHFLAELHDFFLDHLGFGDFVFRMPDGTEIERAGDLRELEVKVAQVPDESLWYHAQRNNFSNWIMSRSEIPLASMFRNVKATDFSSVEKMREYIIVNIHALRKWRQKGMVAQFKAHNFDYDIMDFVKIGQGSLGGKARSLAFMSAMLHQNPDLHEHYSKINIEIPKTLVISTDGFESFIAVNKLKHFARNEFPDQEIAQGFLAAELPEWLIRDLSVYLSQMTHPLSVRSSSLLEDAQFQPYAGIYETYMIPNNHIDFSKRLEQLLTAVKLVYASTYYAGAKAFSRGTSNQPHEEAMAVIIQQLAGEVYGDYFYPAISGVAQSTNFYPIAGMKRGDGIAHIALGLGKTVVEGGRTVRFSPRKPNVLPQFSLVEDTLANAQRYFYALKIRHYPDALDFWHNSNLEKRELDDAEGEPPVNMLASTYVPEEHRIRDSGYIAGPKLLTFAQILKYNSFPLPELLSDILDLGRKGMGCPIEIEFSVNLKTDTKQKSDFFFLQMRPMVSSLERFDVRISPENIQNAFCYSRQALGNGSNSEMADIVYVKPDDFKVTSTVQIAMEIDKLNAVLLNENRPYLLVGPGRWGSADRWLGIPVQWRHISGVGAIVELRNEKLQADPSQGSHFFQNITSLGIRYVTVNESEEDYFDWEWVDSFPAVQETAYLRHVRLEKPFVIKVDGKNSQCVMFSD